MIKIVRYAADGIPFLELLLDETLCSGELYLEQQMAVQVGGINNYLKAKQKYELLIRVAEVQPVKIVEEELNEDREYLVLRDDEGQQEENYGWETDCYVVGRYSEELQKANLLNCVVETLLEEAIQADRKEKTITFLENMIERGESYWHIAEGSQPILIYKGENICYNILNIFAEQLGMALANKGKQIIYFDSTVDEIDKLTEYMYCHFQAVIGVQTFLFSIQMKDEIHYLHEYIYGPKFNFVFDHPVWIYRHLQHHYSDFYVLTLDHNYVRFIEHYYKIPAFFFPPAGMISCDMGDFERIYDFTFIGTYGNYWEQVLMMHQMERSKRFMANHFLLLMRKNPNMTAEKALEETLKEYGRSLSDQEFLNLLYELRGVIYCVMNYYRDRVVRCILESGIQVDVFGDSWKQCSLASYSNLICHPSVTAEESIQVLKQSKISLNVMSWHKGGFTERMANIMLAGAVLVTDETSYLEGRFDENDMISFRLKEYKTLPEKIKYLLNNEEARRNIAQNGKRKTLANHTWEKRAEQLLSILQGRNGN